MNQEIYDPPGSDIIAPERNSLFFRILGGKIKLWKAFCLVHISGALISLAVGLLLQLLVMAVADVRLPHFVTFIPFAIVFPITLACLWRSSPNPKVSIKGALVKMWVCVAAVYYLAMLFRIFSGPI